MAFLVVGQLDMLDLDDPPDSLNVDNLQLYADCIIVLKLSKIMLFSISLKVKLTLKPQLHKVCIVRV